MVLCGNCKQHHETIEAVRACHDLARQTRLTPRNLPRSQQSQPPTGGRRPWRPVHAIPSTFNPEASAYVYLMNHQRMRSLKIGVTAASRIEDHMHHGWDLIQRWYFALGYDALEIEEGVLDRWKNLFSQRSALTSKVMPQGGASETVADTASTRADTIAFVKEFYRERCLPDPRSWDTGIEEFDPWEETGIDEFDPWEGAGIVRDP